MKLARDVLIDSTVLEFLSQTCQTKKVFSVAQDEMLFPYFSTETKTGNIRLATRL